MYQLLKDESSLKFKLVGATQSNNDISTVVPIRPVVCQHGYQGFKQWMRIHEDFIDWLVEGFTNQAYAVNQDISKVHINNALLKKMLSQRVYRSSYNKEKSYAPLVHAQSIQDIPFDV